MVELTRVFTVEITVIKKFDKEEDIIPKEEAKEYSKKALMAAINADDVNITNVQDFVNKK